MARFRLPHFLLAVTDETAYTRTRNGQSGYIRGVEVGGQYTFDWLPSVLSGLGVAGNYTYVESKAERDATRADYDCGYNGLSPHSANGSVFYEKHL